MGDGQAGDVQVQAVNGIRQIPTVNYRIQPLPETLNLQHVHLLAATPMSLSGQYEEHHGGEPQPQPLAVPVQVPLQVPLIQVHYMHDTDHRLEEEDHDNGGGSEAIDGDPTSSDQISLLDPHRTQGNQLTLSFQGEVYVFDSVAPDKVQAVLLLLGGREVPPPNTLSVPAHQNNRAGSPMITEVFNQVVLADVPPRLSMPQRVASLHRFREKRKERNFDKKIRYNVRKEVALRMQRHKGQFTSTKMICVEPASSASSWENASQHWESENNGPQTPQTALEPVFCRHCGRGEKSTPMMRRGPAGPRTLCNACGLMWANKGTLRELSKSTPLPVAPNPPISSTEECKASEAEHNQQNSDSVVLDANRNGQEQSLPPL